MPPPREASQTFSFHSADDAFEAVGDLVQEAGDRQAALGAAVRQHRRRRHEPQLRDVVVDAAGHGRRRRHRHGRRGRTGPGSSRPAAGSGRRASPGRNRSACRCGYHRSRCACHGRSAPRDARRHRCSVPSGSRPANDPPPAIPQAFGADRVGASTSRHSRRRSPHPWRPRPAYRPRSPTLCCVSGVVRD